MPVENEQLARRSPSLAKTNPGTQTDKPLEKR
jgi:hypothetical protein